jgi:KUP system potassium uptake protein
VAKSLAAAEVPLETFFADVAAHPPPRVPGTAVFMTGRPEGTPPILVHHLKHNKALHEQVVLLSVLGVDVPTVPPKDRIEVQPLAQGFHRVIARYGFMQEPDVPGALALAREDGLNWRDEDTTFYLATLTLFASDRIGMSKWRDKLFIFLSRNARRATSFFRIPPEKVVEIGIQLEV